MFVLIPPSAYQTHALVGFGAPASPLRAAMAQAASELAVSQPVLMRAASSLIGTGVVAPAPDLRERIALVVGIEGAKPTASDSRLASDLAGQVSGTTGSVPGTVEIAAKGADASRAAQIASAVAEAFVSFQADDAAKASRLRELAVNVRLDAARAAANAAHNRFASLGGVDIDVARVHAAAAAQVVAAQARYDAIRAIVTSGSPPLCDRKDLPPTIETLQTAYLDLSRQLAKASETLGDRHTTIISLRDGVRRASTSLTAEWKRVERLADADLRAARANEAKTQATAPVDATREAAIEGARRAMQVADEVVIAAQAATRQTPVEERPFQLLARAPVPTAPTGFSIAVRLALAGLAGITALGLARAALRTRPEPVSKKALLREVESPMVVPEVRASFFASDLEEAPVLRERPFIRGDHWSRDEPARSAAYRPSRPAPVARAAAPRRPASAPARAGDAALRQALRDLVPALRAFEPRFGGVPIVMVASNEIGADTHGSALALGRAAAATGCRVLLVEASEDRPALAAAAALDAEPLLVDVLGTLRVVLPAETGGGRLFLAPSLEAGSQIASALARNGEATFIDEIADDFELVVLDGARAADSAAAGWVADAFLRVGSPSSRQDERFLATFGISSEALVGTIDSTSFVPADAPSESHGFTAPRRDTPVGRWNGAPRAESATITPISMARRRATVR